MKKHTVLTLGLVTLLAYATQAGQEELAASITQAREEAAVTSMQLNTTLTALNGLVSQTKGDLSLAYQAFKTEIPKTQSAASATSARVEMMTKERGKYFVSWQNAVNGISNGSLQKKAQKRLNAAAKSYDKVEASLGVAGEKFRPFLSDLADVEKALSHDVTASGVKAMKGVVRSANWNYKSVSNAINKAQQEMQRMEKALSSQAT